MYDIILKWGMEFVTDQLVEKSKHAQAIILETIKIKNELVHERFKHCLEACNEITTLIQDIDEKLCEWEIRKPNGDLSEIIDLYHLGFFRRYRRIRTFFEGGNDLVAAYSLTFSELISEEKIDDLCRITESHGNRQNISMCYKRSWTLLADVIVRLMRLTATDPRFWLNDTSYMCHVLERSKDDFKRAHKWLANEGRGEDTLYFPLSLENPGELNKLWKELEIECRRDIEVE